MKTKNTSDRRFARGTIRIIGGLIALLASNAFVSCGTTSIKTSDRQPVTADAVSWYQVKDTPPTFFPKGVAADHPTGVWDGKWVCTGDGRGTRYFIPEKGANSQARIQSALAQVTPKERARIARKKTGNAAKRTVRTVVATPALLILALGSGY
ncbi:MAG: hypothetical protein ACI8XO_003000 [Verrucomicrobiales bacterium]|jgi:hypothetical protein